MCVDGWQDEIEGELLKEGCGGAFSRWLFDVLRFELMVQSWVTMIAHTKLLNDWNKVKCLARWNLNILKCQPIAGQNRTNARKRRVFLDESSSADDQFSTLRCKKTIAIHLIDHPDERGMVLPLLKLGTLALKTLSKPIAKNLKQQAAIHPQLRTSIIAFAQANHRLTTKIQRRIYGHATDVEIRPLDEEKAVQAAGDLIRDRDRLRRRRAGKKRSDCGRRLVSGLKTEKDRRVADRVRTARIATLKRELEGLRMKEGELVDDYATKLSGLVSKLRSLGHEVEEEEMVRRILDAMPKSFLQIVASIEQCFELDTMFFDEVVGRLKAYEERLKSHGEKEEEKGQLLMASEQKYGESNGSGRGRGKNNERGGRGRGRGTGRGDKSGM
ncbi:hypothetical protein E3N88_04364 [Mikania micrantha]|uniref:Zinc finger, CCHC-type n=1 Tax=Mikania micrantha TaxID=192012 RepID=A0A5N6PW26_9ASTR|nr:hypothetical protein E3N88_04364 [Mikania micrantha]